jgi:biotin carboxyl carrier protein
MKSTFDNTTIELTPSGKGFAARVGDQSFDVELLQSSDGRLDFLINGERVTAYVSSDNNKRWVTVHGQTFVLTKSSDAGKSRQGHHHAAGELTAPMPGQVRAVNVSEGDHVTKGQTLLLLEAMKMEIRIQSPRDGVVKKLFVQQGQTVEREQMLVEIEQN